MACKKPTTSEEPSIFTHVSWDPVSKAALIRFLLKHKSEASDGINFKASTFKATAIRLTSFTIKGGAKTWGSYKNKWAWVCVILVKVF